MGRYLLRYATQMGAVVVGAVDGAPSRIGTDAGELAGTGPSGVTIRPAEELAEVLAEVRPDGVLLATRSLLPDVADELRVIAAAGISVVTTCDEAIFPWNSSPALAAELHELAVASGVTITGSGFPDLAYCHLVTEIAATTPGITRVIGCSTYNADDYGPALAEHHGVGFDREKFESHVLASERLSEEDRNALIAAGKFVPSPMWNANGWLASRMGLHVVRQTQETAGVYHYASVFSKTLEREIRPDEAIGACTTVVTQTAEGITLESTNVGKVYLRGESDTNRWIVKGEVDVEYAMEHIPTSEVVCQLMVARLVDVINAPAGFITTDQLPAPTFRLPPLDRYVKLEERI